MLQASLAETNSSEILENARWEFLPSEGETNGPQGDFLLCLRSALARALTSVLDPPLERHVASINSAAEAIREIGVGLTATTSAFEDLRVRLLPGADPSLSTKVVIGIRSYLSGEAHSRPCASELLEFLRRRELLPVKTPGQTSAFSLGLVYRFSRDESVVKAERDLLSHQTAKELPATPPSSRILSSVLRLEEAGRDIQPFTIGAFLANCGYRSHISRSEHDARIQIVVNDKEPIEFSCVYETQRDRGWAPVPGKSLTDCLTAVDAAYRVPKGSNYEFLKSLKSLLDALSAFRKRPTDASFKRDEMPVVIALDDAAMTLEIRCDKQLLLPQWPLEPGERRGNLSRAIENLQSLLGKELVVALADIPVSIPSRVPMAFLLLNSKRRASDSPYGAFVIRLSKNGSEKRR